MTDNLFHQLANHSAFRCSVRSGNYITWLGGWVSVTRRYCIKTAKPILNLCAHLEAPSF